MYLLDLKGASPKPEQAAAEVTHKTDRAESRYLLEEPNRPRLHVCPTLEEQQIENGTEHITSQQEEVLFIGS